MLSKSIPEHEAVVRSYKKGAVGKSVRCGCGGVLSLIPLVLL